MNINNRKKKNIVDIKLSFASLLKVIYYKEFSKAQNPNIFLEKISQSNVPPPMVSFSFNIPFSRNPKEANIYKMRERF